MLKKHVSELQHIKVIVINLKFYLTNNVNAKEQPMLMSRA